MAVDATELLKAPMCFGSNVTLNFERASKIRRMANTVEDVLSEFFQAPAVVPVADEADPSIPRFVLTSKHGHSTITISQAHLAFETNYSGSFQTDLSARQDYVQQRVAKLFELAEKLELRPLFTGASTNMRMQYSGQDDGKFMDRMFPATMGAPLPKQVYEGLRKITTEVDSKYYCIIIRELYRIWHRDGDSLARMPKEAAIERGVAVLCDFNDRLAYNVNDAYFTNRSMGQHIVNECFRAAEAECKMIAVATNDGF